MEDLQQQVLVASLRAARISELQARDVWTFDDLCFYANVAQGTMEKLIRRPGLAVEGMFTCGKNRHVLADAGKAWVAKLAEMNRTDSIPKTINSQK